MSETPQYLELVVGALLVNPQGHVFVARFPPLYKDGHHHLVYLDFLVEGWEGALQLDGEELSEGQWLLPEDALTLPLTHTTRCLIEHYVHAGPGGPVCYVPDDVPVDDGGKVN